MLDEMSILTPLASLCDVNTFAEIKDNITIKKTNMEFHSFDQTIRYLSFWHINFMCHMP